MSASTLPARAVIREVGLRDGLQAIARTLPTEQKKAWLRGAHAAGQREIEVGSFVPAKYLPQLADTTELVAYGKTLPGLFVSVLVPNLRGAEAALAAQADLMLLPLSASHAHSLANLRKTPDEVVAEVARIRAARDAAGSKTLLEGGMSTAFGCTIQGECTPRCRPALRASTPAWPASAAARTRRAPAATSAPKTWPGCCAAWASTRAWTSTRCWRCASRWPAGCRARRCTARCGARVCPRHCRRINKDSCLRLIYKKFRWFFI